MGIGEYKTIRPMTLNSLVSLGLILKCNAIHITKSGRNIRFRKSSSKGFGFKI